MSRTSHKAGASTKVSPLRLQKEKEDAYADIDRGREKYEKLQVSSSLTGRLLPIVFVNTLPHFATLSLLSSLLSALN